MRPRASGRGAIGDPRPAPKRGRSTKPAKKSPSFVPNFNQPPAPAPVAPAPKPKLRPKAKVGPYTKGYKPGPLGVTSQAPSQLPGYDIRVHTNKHGQVQHTWIDQKSGKPADAQTAQSLDYENTRRAAAQRAAAVKSGQATVDASGKLHYPRQSLRQTVGSDTANTLSLGGLADRTSRIAIGPDLTNAVEGNAFSPIGAGVEALGILPFGKVGKLTKGVADIIGESMRAGRSGEEAIRAAQTATRAAVSASKDRLINVGGLEVRTPGAPEAHVRAVQNALDRNVEKTIARGVAKGMHPQEALGQKGLRAAIARKHLAHEVEYSGFYQNKGALASPRALEHFPKLTDPQKMALRQLARNVHPNVTIKANEARIADALGRGDAQMVSDLKRENHLLRMSRHYIEGAGGSKILLRKGTDKPTRRLALAWSELQRVGKQSELAKMRLGELTSEQAAARVNTPGELDLARAGYEGHMAHEGNVYYPSAPETKKFPSAPYRNRGGIVPFKPRGESKQPFTGALQETGRESYDVTKLVGRQASSRVSREMAIDRLSELRKVAIRGTLPKVGDLEKDFRAIRLTDVANSAATQEFTRLMANLSKKVEWTPQELEAAQQSLKAIKEEVVTDVNKVLEEGKLPKEFGLIRKELLAAIDDPKIWNIRNVEGFQKALMTMSSLTKDMLIYTKIGHAPPRLISNTLMALPDTGTDFLRGVFALKKIASTRPDLSRWVHEMMGGSYFTTYAETTAAPAKVAQKINKSLVGWIEFTADRGPRNAAFLAMAIKDSGKKDLPGLVKYLEQLRDAKPGTEAFHARTRVLAAARQAAGEYERVGKDASLGNWLFLYRWLKAAIIWTARFAVKHPIQAAGVGYLTSQYGYNPAAPIWDRFQVGGHSVTTSVPWSTPVELGERAQYVGRGGFPPFGEGPMDMLNPMIPTLAAGIGHVDIERGEKVRGNAALGALNSFWRQTPPGALVSGKADLRSRIEKFLGGNFLPQHSYNNEQGSTTNVSTAATGPAVHLTKAQKAAIKRAAHVGGMTKAQKAALHRALHPSHR